MAESKREETAPERKAVKEDIKNTAYNLTIDPRWGERIRGRYIWPETVMKVVLARKAARRMEKAAEEEKTALPFNYIVFDFILPGERGRYSLEDNKELARLIDFLKENSDKLPVGLRFQMAVLLEGHWTAVDNVVTAKGISSFNLDSTMDSRAEQFFAIYLANLDRAGLLNAGYSYRVFVPQALFEKTPKEKLANMIQSDWVSCGIFMADHLSYLSRSPVFHHLKASKGESSYQTFGRADVPPALSGIFRLTQMEELITRVSKKQSETVVTRKGKTLADVKKQADPSDKETKYLTANATEKGKKILKDAGEYIDCCEDRDYEAIFSFSLAEKLSAYVDHYSQPVNDLIAFIYDRLPLGQGLSDEDSIRLMEGLHQVILSPGSDQEKIISIHDQLMSALENTKEASAYRLMAAVTSYTALHIKDNNALWSFYQCIRTGPMSQQWHSHSNWFFNIPSKMTPALFSYIEKAVKTQLLSNALANMQAGERDALAILDSEDVTAFLQKPRTFETSETKSAQLLRQLKKEGEAGRSSDLRKIDETLEKRREEVLGEFGMSSSAMKTSDHKP